MFSPLFYLFVVQVRFYHVLYCIHSLSVCSSVSLSVGVLCTNCIIIIIIIKNFLELETEDEIS